MIKENSSSVLLVFAVIVGAIVMVDSRADEPRATQSNALLKQFADEFVSITPGKGRFPKEFDMGDAHGHPTHPIRQVTFSASFKISKYETTQDLWREVMGSNPSRWKGDRNSVEMLSYHDANRFCQRVTKRLKDMNLIASDEVIRLPSEAEWEYCARAGTKSLYSFGDNKAELDAYAWHAGNAAGNDPPVGAKKPNPWGLYDMHGYLWEWCSPWKNATDVSAKGDEQSAVDCVIRGGSWKDAAPKLVSSSRMGIRPTTKDDAVGFRCVRAAANPK